MKLEIIIRYTEKKEWEVTMPSGQVLLFEKKKNIVSNIRSWLKTLQFLRSSY